MTELIPHNKIGGKSYSESCLAAARAVPTCCHAKVLRCGGLGHWTLALMSRAWCLGQSGPGQSGPGQSGPGQSGPGQNGPGQSGPGQSGPGQNGPGQMVRGKVVRGKDGPGQSGPGLIHIRYIYIHTYSYIIYI